MCFRAGWILLLWASCSALCNGQSINVYQKLGGHSTSVAVHGRYAYTNQGSSLLAIDAQNPSNPVILDSIDVNQQIKAIAADENNVYLACGAAGVLVVNVRNPSDIRYGGVYDTPGEARDLDAAGGFVYVADNSKSCWILSSADSSTPTLAGVYNAPANVIDIDIDNDNNRAYLAVGGMEVLDLSDPIAPQLLGAYTATSVYRVYGADNHALVESGMMDGTILLNCIDPKRISKSSVVTYDIVSRSAFKYGHAYTTAGLMEVYDCGTARATRLGAYGPTSDIYSEITISGKLGFLAGGVTGLAIFDLTNPAAPVLKGRITPLLSVVPSATAGNLGFTVEHYEGFKIYDFANPVPRLLCHYPNRNLVSEWTNSIAVEGDIACVLDRFVGLDSYGRETILSAGRMRVMDVHDPTSPTTLGIIPNITSGQALSLKNGMAVVGGQDVGIALYDLTNPRNPVPRGALKTIGSPRCIKQAGDMIYVANGTYVVIVDAKNPDSLVKLTAKPSNEWVPGMSAQDLAVVGKYVYAACGTNLKIIDVSVPATPTQSLLTVPATYVTVAGSTLVTSIYKAVNVFDLADLAIPRFIAATPDLAYAGRVAVFNNRAYIGNDSLGIWVTNLGRNGVRTPWQDYQ